MSIAEFSTDTLGPDGRGQYRYTLWRHGLQQEEQHSLLPASQGTCRRCAYPIRAGRCACRDRSEEYVQFICLNPSTADETTNDPTVTRCVNFCLSWGFGSFVMTNLFALRSTDPRVMLAHPEPIGPENNDWLCVTAERAGLVVLGWGCHGTHGKRNEEVVSLLRDNGQAGKLHLLKKTMNGHPQHPLYVRADLTPVPVNQVPEPPPVEPRR